MIIAYLANASSMHTIRWCESMADLGHQVHLVSFEPYSGDHPSITWHQVTFSHQWVARGFEFFYRARQAIRKILDSIQPDILHAHYVLGPGNLAFISGWRPFVVTAWGSDIYLHRENSLAARLLSRLTLRSADLLTCDSQDLKQAMTRLGAPPDRIHVIQFGVDTSRFKPGLDTSGIHRQLNIGSSAPIILSSRALKPIYNIDVLIQGFAALRAEFPGCVLLVKDINPEPAYRDKIIAMVQALGLANNVRFIPFTPYEDQAYLYNLADVVVSAAISDGTPMTVLESMACGRLNVVSDLPSLREWIKDNENGYLVDPNNPQDIANKISQAIKLDGNTRQAWAQLNRSIISDRADQHKNIAEMERLYKSLVAKHKGM